MKLLAPTLLALLLVACPSTTTNNPATAGTSLNFNASTSRDPSPDALAYTWNFGIGSGG